MNEEKKPDEIMKDAVDAIIEKSIPIIVDVADVKWYHNSVWPKPSRTFTIKPLVLGTMLKIAVLLLEFIESVDDDSEARERNFFDIIVERKDAMVHIVALAIVNRKKEPPKSLERFLDNNLTAKELLHVMALVMKQMNVTDFFRSTVLATGLNLLEKVEKKNTQISGRKSEPSSNTSDSNGAKSSGNEAIKTS